MRESPTQPPSRSPADGPTGSSPGTLESPLGPIASRLQSAINGWPAGDAFGADEDFDGWAMEVHRAQAAAYPVLEAFWSRRTDTPAGHWTEIPPVPARAFKEVRFGPPDPEAVFRTSGTTSGGGAGDPHTVGEGSGTGGMPSGRAADPRGEHRVLSLELYKAAARANYRRSLFPGAEQIRVLSLIPNPTIESESSLARMAGFISGEPEVAQVTWAFEPDTGVDLYASRMAAHEPGPVMILATAFALVQLLDSIQSERWSLPGGSLVMETGGFKGRVASVARADLYARIENGLGIPEERIIGEYGMTELLSQSYDGVCGHGRAVHERRHRFPPWVRTLVLDPVSLEPVPSGERGLLAHHDLANVGSVCYVLTEDVGVRAGADEFVLLGRASGAETRGCSLMAEEFLSATRRSG